MGARNACERWSYNYSGFELSTSFSDCYLRISFCVEFQWDFLQVFASDRPVLASGVRMPFPPPKSIPQLRAYRIRLICPCVAQS